MTADIDRRLARIERMTVGQLLETYREVFGCSSSSRHKQHLVRQIAWGWQAGAEGGLSERALRRAAELVENNDLRVSTATGRSPSREARTARSRRLPIPGTVLVRQYKGRRIEVEVLEDGFRYEGHVFQSLSALAKAITGSHWNGYRFFGLANRRR